MSVTYWNGQLWPQGAVRITLDDAGLLFGDGLFETLRVDDGQALDIEAHLDRLLAGLTRIGIGIPETREDLETAVEKVAREAPGEVARLRITITRGAAEEPTRLITTASYDPPSEEQYRNGVAVLLLTDLQVDSRGPLVGLKSLSYQMNRLALRRAEAAGCFEALLLNERGLLVEGSRTNVVVALPEGVFTPPLSDGCLPGTVRRRLLEQGKIAERSLTPEDLAGSDRVYLLNSLIGELPARSK